MIFAWSEDRSSRRKLTIDAIPSDICFPSVQYGANDNQSVGVVESSRLGCTEPPPPTLWMDDDAEGGERQLVNHVTAHPTDVQFSLEF